MSVALDEQAQNWRDLRSDPSESGGMNTDSAAPMSAWCHGAPGIGLSRIAMLGGTRGLAAVNSDDAEFHQEIRIALQTTIAHGFGGGHCLCHGDLGNVELLVKASQVLDDATYMAQARTIAGNVLAHSAQTGWLCGVPGGVETPGLMVGLAGIGYELLRLQDPARVPSALLMGPPC